MTAAARPDGPPEVRLILGDCLAVMTGLEADSVDAVCTDPPGGIAFMGRKFDDPRTYQSDKARLRDRFLDFLTPRLAECLRLARPGARLLCWSIPRTSHWTGTAIEDAGWIIEDRIAHINGQGFPKSKGKLKPAIEDWWLARKPSRRVPDLNIEACRVGGGGHLKWSAPRDMGYHGGRDEDAVATANPSGRYPANLLISHVGGPDGCRRVGTRRVKGSNGSGEQFQDPPHRAHDVAVIGDPNQSHPHGGDGGIQVGVPGLESLSPVLNRVDFDQKIVAGDEEIDGETAVTEIDDVLVDDLNLHDRQDIEDNLFDIGDSEDLPDCVGPGTVGRHGGDVPFPADVLTGIRTEDPAASPPDPADVGFEVLPADRTGTDTAGLRLLEAEDIGTLTGTGGPPAHPQDGIGDAVGGVADGAFPVASGHGESSDRGDGKNLTYYTKLAPSEQETVEAWLCHPACPVYLLDLQSGDRPGDRPGRKPRLKRAEKFGWSGDAGQDHETAGFADRGGCSRFFPTFAPDPSDDITPFFYCSKASRRDRGEGNNHPTCKSTKLCEWLIRLITPPGGTVLDPFMGSGSIGLAAARLGYGYLGIESDPAYHAIAERRLAAARAAHPLFPGPGDRA